MAMHSSELSGELVLHGGGTGEEKWKLERVRWATNCPCLVDRQNAICDVSNIYNLRYPYPCLRRFTEFKSIVTKANEGCANEI
jgi:hypothetical protein